MKHTTLKLAGMALAIAASALTGRADVTLNDNVSTYGYVSALLGYTQYGNGVHSSTSLDVNAAKIGFAYNLAPVTAKMSIYSSGHTLYLLEANATYDIGQGLSITGGRFQSWLGYEPFDVPNANFITNGNLIANLIPNFHEGAKIEYAIDKKSTVGIAVVNSIYNGANAYAGDGSLSDGYGVEAHYGYNDGALSIGAVAAYQNSRLYRVQQAWKNAYIGDIWAQYIINNKTTLAAEFYYSRVIDTLRANFTGGKDNVYYGLITAKQQFTDIFSLALRGSMGNDSTGDFMGLNLGNATTSSANFWKVSLTPACTVTKNLVVAGEISYQKYNKTWAGAGKDSNTFVGVLACFHF